MALVRNFKVAQIRTFSHEGDVLCECESQLSPTFHVDFTGAPRPKTATNRNHASDGNATAADPAANPAHVAADPAADSCDAADAAAADDDASAWYAAAAANAAAAARVSRYATAAAAAVVQGCCADHKPHKGTARGDAAGRARCTGEELGQGRQRLRDCWRAHRGSPW